MCTGNTEEDLFLHFNRKVNIEVTREKVEEDKIQNWGATPPMTEIYDRLNQRENTFTSLMCLVTDEKRVKNK